MGPHNCGYTTELYSIVYTIHSLKTIRGWNVSRVQKYPPYGQVGSAINVHTVQHFLKKVSAYKTIQNYSVGRRHCLRDHSSITSSCF